MRALLDINVLIALVDENHTSHPIASRWFAAHVHLALAIAQGAQLVTIDKQIPISAIRRRIISGTPRNDAVYSTPRDRQPHALIAAQVVDSQLLMQFTNPL